MTLLKLFCSFMVIGLFSFGGGYASLPLMEEQVIHLHNWLTAQEFTNAVAIAQMAPGAIVLNAATFVGIKIHGPVGAIISNLGFILPPALIVMLLGIIHKKYKDVKVIKGILAGLRPAVVGIIASAAFSLISTSFCNGEPIFNVGISGIDFILVGLFAVLLAVTIKFKLNPVYVIIISGVAGALLPVI